MKKVLKIGSLLVVVLYLILYVSYQNGYYERLNQTKKVMTDEMILKYEEDLKNGIDVTKNDYTVNDHDYSNIYTKTSLKAASKIEHLIDKSIKFVFKKINDMVGES